MTTTLQDRPDADERTRSRPSPALVALVVAAFGVIWPGGRVPLADTLFMLAVMALLFRAVVRHPSFGGIVAAAPASAKRIAAVVLAAFLLGQLWGTSAQTYPAATWTMYSHGPGTIAPVYRFDAVNAQGHPVAFTPSASNRTLPAKMALVHLRRISQDIHRSMATGDTEQLVLDQDRLRRALVAYVAMHNASSNEAPPVTIEASRIVYDVSQEVVPMSSGERTVLLRVELDPS